MYNVQKMRLRAVLNNKLLFRFLHFSKYSVEIPDCSISEYVFKGLKSHGNELALINGTKNYERTFNQLHEETDSVSRNLVTLGLRMGDAVCLCGTNAPEFAHVFLGVTRIGAALTIANSQITPGELSAQIKETRSRILIVTEDCASKAIEVQRFSNDMVKTVVVLGNYQGCLPFNNLLQPAPSFEIPTISPSSQIALIPYSSGTTGLPKGVLLTHKNLVAELAALGHRLFLPFNEGDSSLVVLPIVHIAGLVIGMLNPLSQGATVVTLPKFQPESFLSAMVRFKITFALIAPPVVSFLANDALVDKYDLRHWRTPYSGSAPLSKEITEKMIKRTGLTGIRQGYGMSEASPATHTAPLDGWKHGSIGVPLPNTESKIVNPDTLETMSVNEQGEIWVRGPQVMKGYLNNPEDTKSTLTGDGWLRTGDIGFYDEDHHYFVVDRLKEIIKYKGYQISPAYLESLLMQHACIKDVAVVGIPHEVHGHLPAAFVVAKGQVTEKEITDFVNAQVSPYKRLRGGVYFVNAIPRSPSGKILRRKLVSL